MKEQPVELHDFQKRVIDEKDQLDEKISKLNNFLSSDASQNLPPGDRVLLQEQFTVMRQYSRILRDRIDTFFM